MARIHYQADLFQGHREEREEALANKPAFLDRFQITVRLDQVLVVIIGLILLNAFVYARGLEKGKQLSEIRIPATPAQAILREREKAPAPQAAAAVPAIAEKVPVAEAPPAALETPASLRGKYTIQLVTYLSEAAAQQQISKLRKKGLDGFVIPSGKFHQVCVQDFQSRTDAKSRLSELQSVGIAPKDAYIRAIPAA